MKFTDIPQFLTNKANYNLSTSLKYFEMTLQDLLNEGLILNPDFQRGHVWTEEQQIAYIEYFLKGGLTGRDFYFNKPSWHIKAKTDYDDFVCVDGLQRITAVLRFLHDEIPAFGLKYSEFEGHPRDVTTKFNIYINDLQYKKEVLQWYVEMNSGGTPHTNEEIERVVKMMEECE